MSTRAVQGAALSLSAVLVILHLSATDQGFYFAFISFGVLLQLCDFGLSYAGLQAASHLLATGRSDRLGDLMRHALRINLVGTTVATAVVVVLGTWTFAGADGTTAWVAPWLLFVAGVALNHLTAPAIFIVEGGVSVTRAWQVRLLQEAVAGTALLAILAIGDGLWSLVAYYWARTLIGAWWLQRSVRPLFARTSVTTTWRHWLGEMWPFQWRVGVGAISNFLVFQAFGPILFALRGPTEAGRFSLSLAAMNAIVMVTTAWPISQAAHFGVMLTRQDAARMRAHWRTTSIGSTSFTAVSALAAILTFAWLPHWQPALTMRFAGPVTTSLLIASAVAHHAVACFAVVVRAERHDPLMTIGIVGGLVTVGLMTIAAASDVPDLVAIVYCACTTATVVLAYRVYRRFAQRRFDLPV